MPRAPLLGLVGVLVSTFTGCATHGFYSSCASEPDACRDPHSTQPDGVVFLIGDAGNVPFDRNPVLQELQREVDGLDATGIPSWAVFLGDNVYDEGIRDGHPEDVARLDAQVQAVRAPGARGFFIAGNHDWGNTVRDWGLVRMRNQESLLAEALDVDLRPRAGCIGPDVEILEDRRGRELARVIFLDTQLWLGGRLPEEGCAVASGDEVAERLVPLLAARTDLPLLVAGHHPVRTGGPHGGNVGFPEWLANRGGLLSQDLNSSLYERFSRRVMDSFEAASRSVVYASGHEHGLQVIEEPLPTGVLTQLVSGAGSKTEHVAPVDGSQLAAAVLGYMRIDLRRGDPPRLTVLALCPTGAEAEAPGAPPACAAGSGRGFATLLSMDLDLPS